MGFKMAVKDMDAAAMRLRLPQIELLAAGRKREIDQAGSQPTAAWPGHDTRSTLEGAHPTAWLFDGGSGTCSAVASCRATISLRCAAHRGDEQEQHRRPLRLRKAAARERRWRSHRRKKHTAEYYRRGWQYTCRI